MKPGRWRIRLQRATPRGGRLNDQNLMLGAIGTQTDKTAEALTAFIDLVDNMARRRGAL